MADPGAWGLRVEDPARPTPVHHHDDSAVLTTIGLILAIVPVLHGYLLIPAAVIAVVALVRSRNGHDYGRKRAIATLVIAWLKIIVSFTLGLLSGLGVIDVDQASPSPSASVSTSPRPVTPAIRDIRDHVTVAGLVTADDLHTGDCLVDPTTLGTATALSAVPCREPHHTEVFAVADLDGPYPGADATRRLASNRCAARLAALGPDVRADDLAITFVYPLTAESFAQSPSVACLAETADHAEVTGSHVGR